MSNSSKEANSGAKHAVPKKKQFKLPKGLVAACAVIVILFGVMAVWANTYTGIYPYTYVNGFLVSDMSETELADFLTSTYSADKLKNLKFTLVCEDIVSELGVADIGLVYDNAALAEDIVTSGKEGNFFTRTIAFISRPFKPVSITPVIEYNKEVLAQAFDLVTEQYEIEPVGYTFDIGENLVTIHDRVSGLKADREKATAKVEEMLASMAIGEILLVPEEITPEPLDFDEFYKWLTSDAQDAYYEKVDSKVIVRDSKPKCEVDRQVVADALSTLDGSDLTSVQIAVKTSQPENTSDHLREILYKDKLGSYSTGYGGSSAARANNVRLATSRVDGIELMPGEEFSYDDTILPRTAANGYMAAAVYVGNKVESGMGGGICQPSSTLYAAALYANLEIVERHNHSLTVSYLPPGLDATIAEGYLDLRLKNNTDYPVKISASASGGIVSFSIYGYNENNTSVDILRSFSNGKYYVTRVVKENGVEVRHEQMTSSVYGTPEPDEPEEEKKPEEEKPAEGETPENGETPADAATPEETAPEVTAPTEQAPPEAAPTPQPETSTPPAVSETAKEPTPVTPSAPTVAE